MADLRPFIEGFASPLPAACRKGNGSDPLQDYTTPNKDTQLGLSLALGLTSFLAFCLLRPRWTGLYAARKKQKNAAAKLPELPKSLFGWIPVLYRITEEEVLASAGLDAFVFLRFFKLAIKFLAFVLFFVLSVIVPVHYIYDDQDKETKPKVAVLPTDGAFDGEDPDWADYLWVYVVFAYLFTAAAIYLIITETNHVIKVRQRYLSTHSTVTDRTIRLSGIPMHLRSEQAIKEVIEDLQIGKVESVTLCKKWHELDSLIDRRMAVLRKLEEVWTVYLGYRRKQRKLDTLRQRRSLPPPQEENEMDRDARETDGLLLANGDAHGNEDHVTRTRPTTRLWYGFMKLQSRRIDAIDYYEEQLRKLDEDIKTARQKEYAPASLAFVTLDSIAACQMAIQAIIDPAPMQLIANPAPAPEDVVWRNTYLSRRHRMTKAWTVTLFVALLTWVWWAIFIPLAVFLNIEAIGKVSPPLKDFLCAHEQAANLVRTTLPTLILSLMLVLVPYLYDWLSNLQGMTSQGDAEMSVISKNFFFTFFNLFVSFTLFGTASNFYKGGFWEYLKQLSPGQITSHLAGALSNLSGFYTNLILLQAIGLSPFRLLEFGAVTLYPVGLMGSKTPRDYAELMYPPIFSYGFYLPQIQFIFLICIVYSVLPNSEWMLLYGIIYFMVSSFIYKYQLLYAMDHRHFSTGRAWVMICNRITVALLVFHVTMASQLGLRIAWKRAILMIPLFIATVWFSIVYTRTYEPLMRFISLRSLRDAQDERRAVDSANQEHETTTSGDIDNDLSRTYVNPSLVIPLEDVWLSKGRAQRASFVVDGNGNGTMDGNDGQV